MAIASVSSPSSSRRRPTIPSTCAAKPKITPERIASTVDLPISARGAVEVDPRDRRRAARERLHRDLDARRDDPADVLAGRADAVVGDRGAEVDDHARPADALVGRDRVDEPVGADLARVVHPDRHPGPHARADHRHLVPEVALGHRGPLRPQLRHGRGEDRRVEVVEAEVAQREQVAQRGAELVRGGLAHGGEAPVVDQLLPAEGAQVGLRVADVDDEEHDAGLCSRAMDAVLYALPASHPCAAVERALALKGVAYRRVELIPGPHRIVQKAVLRRDHRAGRAAVRRHEGRRLAADHAGARRAGARAAARARRSAGAARAEEWGDQVLQSLVRRVVWAALVRAPEPGHGLHRRARSCRSRGRSRGSARRSIARLAREAQRRLGPQRARRPARAAAPPRPGRRLDRGRRARGGRDRGAAPGRLRPAAAA